MLISTSCIVDESGHEKGADCSSQDDCSITTPPAKRRKRIEDPFCRYKKYLQLCYEDEGGIAYDDKLLISPCSEFISLKLVLPESKLHGGTNRDTPPEIPIKMEDIVSGGSHFVRLEGSPGIGKSTLCRELCRKWEQLFSHFEIVKLVRLREERIQNATKLSQIFYHDDKKLCERVESKMRACSGKGVLLILDGFDEMPPSLVKNKCSLIMPLISHDILPEATRLVTTRPQDLKQECFPRKFRHIKIHGFTEESITKYAEGAFQSETKVLTDFKQFLVSNPVIRSFMSIPMNCAIIVEVYKDIRNSNRRPHHDTALRDVGSCLDQEAHD